jgi:hypothetical protein
MFIKTKGGKALLIFWGRNKTLCAKIRVCIHPPTKTPYFKLSKNKPPININIALS